MARVLILGGGFGGVSAAHYLRLLAPEYEVVLVARDPDFMMGFRKNSELVGGEPMQVGRRPLASLERRGVRFLRGSIARVDPGARAVEVEGRTLEADALIVALGAEVIPGPVPGLAEHGHNVYDPAAVPAAARALASLRGGRVVVGIFGAPYTCPPAPYELALLASEAAAGRDARVEFAVFTPQPMSLPVLGPAGVRGRGGAAGTGGHRVHRERQGRACRGRPGHVPGRRGDFLRLGFSPCRRTGAPRSSWTRGSPSRAAG